METPNTEAGRLTERIMAKVRGRLPSMSVHEYNVIYECCLETLTVTPPQVPPETPEMRAIVKRLGLV